jgi:hypothetical protein
VSKWSIAAALVGVAGAVGGTWLILWVPMRPYRPGVNPEAYNLIRVGMPREKAEAILGGPPRRLQNG